ncbi:MAG: tRNA (adenosine(37)-N6)-threonylcarbamoyltransferase complex dimerization subunit type 1 TsaB [Rhodoferax sp.]|nr:tRNA (adenosine(37)-N6)-threonylcarbamoyltransferase complex dimerization subunit type 1 TsaB [Rhodoferax sp.]
MKLLAFDTSADVMSLAVARDDGKACGLWQMQGQGGAKASSSLIGSVLDLLKKADLALTELDAICFGCGPGYFTGLRTACAVAQGLALGAKVPVLPINSLLALAEAARHSHLAQASHLGICAMLDARMDEIYFQRFDYAPAGWTAVHSARLLRPQDLTLNAAPGAPDATVSLVAAGNVFAVYADRLHGIAPAVQRIHALPQATAMLRLAPQLLAAGQAVTAQQALPVYVRNKVAQTSAERAALKAAQPQLQSQPPTQAVAP